VADTSKAIAWGAAPLSDNALDVASRSSSNALGFLAQVVLDSQNFVLLSTSQIDCRAAARSPERTPDPRTMEPYISYRINIDMNLNKST